MKISVSAISPNPQQPRQYFDPQTLQQLADSIKAIGLEQPVLVEDCGDGKYILVDGERRWRAHKMLGLTAIEANVRPLTNHKGKQRLVSAVAANLARDAINAVDEAAAYKKMREEMGMSVNEISEACGVSSVTIYARLKINQFTDEELALFSKGLIPTQSEAIEALLAIPDVKSRTEMIIALSKRSPTVKIVVSACKQFVEIKKQARNVSKKKNSGTPALVKIKKQPNEWDALYQINRVPPWKNFTEAIMSTCDKCALRPVASEATCRDCPMVDMIETMMGSVK